MPPDPGLQGVWCPTRFHLGLLWHPDDVGLRAVLEVLLPWMQVLPDNSPQGSMSLTYSAASLEFTRQSGMDLPLLLSICRAFLGLGFSSTTATSHNPYYFPACA